MARTRQRPSGLTYTTISQFKKIRKELGVDRDVLRVIGSYIGLKMPMTKAHYLTFKLNKEFHGRYQMPAQPDSLYLCWKRWNLRYKKNNHGWRHQKHIRSCNYERIQYSRYRANNWVPIYDGDRCTPTFYDRFKIFPDKIPGDPRIREFDRKYSYGHTVKQFTQSETEHWQKDTPYECKNERRFYHGIHNLKMELEWLGHWWSYLERCCSDKGWRPSLKDALTKINVAKIKMCDGWYGFFMRYGIDPVRFNF